VSAEGVAEAGQRGAVQIEGLLSRVEAVVVALEYHCHRGDLRVQGLDLLVGVTEKVVDGDDVVLVPADLALHVGRSHGRILTSPERVRARVGMGRYGRATHG
jgi:hypothetical protein